MSQLNATDITISADSKTLVDAASFSCAPGELVALLGPNGAGKTSLLRASLGLETPAFGRAVIGTENVSDMTPVQRARQVAYLPQTRPLAWPNLVRDVVALGRFSHGVSMGRLHGADLEAVDRALADCQLQDLANRRTDTLSGGELARVHCARALAANAPLLIADEPVAALDPRHQFQIMDLIKSFVGNGGGALVVLHDISLAARYATRIIWMKDGKIYADGKPANMLTPDWLADIYGVRAVIDGHNISIEGAI